MKCLFKVKISSWLGGLTSHIVELLLLLVVSYTSSATGHCHTLVTGEELL